MFERGPRTNTEGTKRRRDRRRWKERKRDRENIQEIAVPLTTTTGATTVLHATKTFSGTDGPASSVGRGRKRRGGGGGGGGGVERLGILSPRQIRSVSSVRLRCHVSLIVGFLPFLAIKISPINCAWSLGNIGAILPIQGFAKDRRQSSFFGSSFKIQRD